MISRNLNRLALAISVICSPFLITGILPVYAIYQLAESDRWRLSFLWLLFSTFVPLLYIIFLKYSGKITDMHVALREQRSRPFLVAIASALILVIIFYVSKVPIGIMSLALLLLTQGVVFYISTLRWKLSVHIAAVVGISLSLGILIDQRFFWLLVLVPIVGWARIYRKKHTIQQVLGAAVITTVLTLTVYLLTGVLKIV